MNRTSLITTLLSDARVLTKLSRQTESCGPQSLMSPALDETLVLLGDQPTTIKLLANLLRITSGAATQQVIALEDLGYVQRHPNPEDRRETFVSLTSAGMRAQIKAELIQAEIAERLFAALDNNEMKQLATLIKKLITEKEI